MKKWDHDEPSEDLAIAKGGIPYLNVCLGSQWGRGRTPRADLLICRPTYKKFNISIFEIKISRSDFLSDIRSGKWEYYLPHCHRFYFATPPNLINKSEIPNDAGWIVRGNNGWKTINQCESSPKTIEYEVLLSLIFAKQRRSRREKRLDDILAMNERQSWYRVDFGGRLKAARVLGEKLGKLHELAMQFGGIEKTIEYLQKNLGVKEFLQ